MWDEPHPDTLAYYLQIITDLHATLSLILCSIRPLFYIVTSSPCQRTPPGGEPMYVSASLSESRITSEFLARYTGALFGVGFTGAEHLIHHPLNIHYSKFGNLVPLILYYSIH
jgi:hypothetical protein